MMTAERLAPAAILQTWEICAPRGPIDRALGLLWAAAPDTDEDLAALPLAERDRRLLALRRATFGETMPCITACPHCDEVLEFELSASKLRAKLRALALEQVEHDGQTVKVRALDSRDLAAAAAVGDPEAAVALLRGRCCEVEDGSNERGFDALHDTVRAEIEARIEARELASEMRLSLNCETCGTTWDELFDIGEFVWLEVEAAARRLFGEVAEITAALGWSETEILAMSTLRRRAYLQIARGG